MKRGRERGEEERRKKERKNEEKKVREGTGEERRDGQAKVAPCLA